MHCSVAVQNRTPVYMNLFDHKDLGNHLLQLCAKVVKHPVYVYIYIYIYIHIHIKVKLPRYRPGVARGWVELQLYSSTAAALEGSEWLAARPGRTLPPGKTWYPFYRRLSGPQDRSGRVENLASTRIRSRTVQAVVSRYTDWATRSTHTHTHTYIYICVCVCVCVCL